MTDAQKKTAETIYDTMMRKQFEDWYETGNFDANLRGITGHVPKEKVVEDIVQLFRVGATGTCGG